MEQKAKGTWFEIVLSTASTDVDIVTALLAHAGYASCEIRDARDDRTDVVVYTNARDISVAMKTARRLADVLPRVEEQNVSVHALDDVVWSENWKLYFAPMSVGERIEIVPPWEARKAGDRGADDRQRVRVVINPGMAFGTGHHETTTGCLQLLDDLIEPGWRMADVGCGSGILAITALKLGASEAVATDNDPEAVNAARENAVLNDVGERLIVHLREGPPTDEDSTSGAFDIVASNIYAETLVAMRHTLTSCVKNGGYLLLSGIEAGRRSLIEEEFVEPDWPIVRIVEAGNWLTFALRNLTEMPQSETAT